MKGLPWLRLYVDLVNNRKAQMLDGETFKRWIGLLCLARNYDGKVPPVQDVAFSLRIDEAAAADLIRRLHEAKLLDQDDDVHYLHDWGEHQYPSDSPTERVRKHRARVREQKEPIYETLPERFSNKQEGERETLPERFSNVIEQSRADTDTEQSRTDAEGARGDFDSDVPAVGHAEDGFQEFWQRYPKRSKELPTQRAYCQVITTAAEHAALMAGLERWLASGQWVRSQRDSGTQFIVDPDRFILEARYREQPEPHVETSGPGVLRFQSAVDEDWLEELRLRDEADAARIARAVA